MTESNAFTEASSKTDVVSRARLLDLPPGDRHALEQFAAWLTSVQPTRARTACWTDLGLEYAAIDPAWARDNSLEGWTTWPDR